MIRIYHHWEKWECFRAGMYETVPPPGLSADECRRAYADFLTNDARFSMAMQRVLDEWPNSCDQFLSNEDINRVAWMGQASMCIETGVPCVFRGGFKLLSKKQQDRANALAAEYVKKWSKNERLHGRQSQSIRLRVAQQGLF